MAVKKSLPTAEKESEKNFPTKGKADQWFDEQKKKYKQLGMSCRGDINYMPATGQWKVTLQIW